jgi:multidrug efflux pump subunit AcrB
MAVTIVFGLLFASILTLILVPVLYSLFFRVRPT